MARTLHILSTFGFGAAAGVAPPVIHPWPAAVPVSAVLLLLCATLQAMREQDVAGQAAAAQLRGGR